MRFEEFRAAMRIASSLGLMVSAAMAVVALASVVLGWEGAGGFAVAAAGTGLANALVLLATQGPNIEFSPRFGFILVNLFWWWVSVVGAVPFVIGPSQLAPVDAFFETVSGLTTTGSTVMVGLDTTARSILIWRSLLHAIGGIGILSLALFLLPYLKVGGMQLLRMESSDRAEKPLPRMLSLAGALLNIYLLMMLGCFLAYGLAGMSSFEAFNHALSTISTGGFSTSDSSLGHFDSTAILAIATVFMILGSLPFSMYIVLIYSSRRTELDPQVVPFLVVVLVSTLVLLLLRAPGEGVWSVHGVVETLFNVVSVLSTTGFASTDYMLWGEAVWPVFFFVTFLGGCAGSTSGGIKVYRLMVLLLLIRSSIHAVTHPHRVIQLRYGGRQVPLEMFRSAMVLICSFLAAQVVISVLVGATGVDFLTAVSGTATALANVGPGIGPVIGPAGNFSTLPDAAKLLLAFAMVLGRLEVIVVIALFALVFSRD